MAAVADRHRQLHGVLPQTAAKCGVSASLVQGVLDEIENDTDRAIDAAVSDLPPGFPERIVSSVIEGVRPAAAFVYPCDGMSGKSAELADLVALN